MLLKRFKKNKSNNTNKITNSDSAILVIIVTFDDKYSSLRILLVIFIFIFIEFILLNFFCNIDGAVIKI